MTPAWVTPLATRFRTTPADYWARVCAAESLAPLYGPEKAPEPEYVATAAEDLHALVVGAGDPVDVRPWWGPIWHWMGPR